MIYLKWIGALLIVGGCGFWGIYTAMLHNSEENSLRKLIAILDHISCELQYKLTPLPDLCRQAGREAKGSLQKLFLIFADELDNQLHPEVKGCMNEAVKQCPALPELTRKCVLLLGSGMGRFEMAGQIKAIDSVRAVCRRHLQNLEENKDIRLRTYQTLGLCAGAALVIIFI